MFQGDPTESPCSRPRWTPASTPWLSPVAVPATARGPFDPAVRLMATYHEADGGRMLCVKGAPAAVLEASVQYDTPAGVAILTEEIRARLLETNRALARDGLRVLAIAWRPGDWDGLPSRG